MTPEQYAQRKSRFGAVPYASSEQSGEAAGHSH